MVTDSQFGRAIAAADEDSHLDLERSFGKNASFEPLDQLIGSLVQRTFSGEKLVEATQSSARLTAIPRTTQSLIDSTFARSAQQSNGAWFIPESLSLQTGVPNFGFYISKFPRYCMALAEADKTKLKDPITPDHIFLWCLLQPSLKKLFQPFFLRGMEEAQKDASAFRADFDACQSEIVSLSTGARAAFDLIGPQVKWSALTAEERVANRQRAFMLVGAGISDKVGQRLRVRAIAPLITRYYSKSKNGPPTQRQVLTKSLEGVLSAYFGGSWLGFLEYLDEKPSSAEQIITSLPEPKLVINTGARIGDVASKLNLPAAEVANVLAAFWNSDSSASPVERRVAAMAQFWAEFCRLHEKQRSGMEPLWGLTGEDDHIGWQDEGQVQPFRPGLYNRLLSQPLLKIIAELWGRRIVAERPNLIVDAQFPHSNFSAAFGPALRFWNGCSLTAWFLCEGPYSRTDMAGLSQYHRKDLAALSEIGCPIDSHLFAELIEGERKLGAPVPTHTDQSTHEVATALGTISFTTSMSSGQKRSGFEGLNDIITKHRAAWAENHLSSYLSKRPEKEIRLFAVSLSQFIAQKGKAPTLKAISRAAQSPTDHWFGGNIALLYAAIGEKLPEPTRYVPTVPYDPRKYVASVFGLLGGVRMPSQTSTLDSADSEKSWSLRVLANQSLRYLEVLALLERNPTQDEFKPEGLERAIPFLGGDVTTAWMRFVEACHGASRLKPD